MNNNENQNYVIKDVSNNSNSNNNKNKFNNENNNNNNSNQVDFKNLKDESNQSQIQQINTNTNYNKNKLAKSPPPLPPKFNSNNINQQSSLPIGQQEKTYRQPPPPPTTTTSMNIQSTSDQKTSISSASSSSSGVGTAPPQPPARTHLKTSHRLQPQMSLNPTNNSPQTKPLSPSMSSNIQYQHENASDVAARLVYKTVMMGSVPSLNQNLDQIHQQTQQQEQQQNFQQHLRNLSISSAGSGDAQPQQTSGNLIGKKLSEFSNHHLSPSSNEIPSNNNNQTLVANSNLNDKNTQLSTTPTVKDLVQTYPTLFIPAHQTLSSNSTNKTNTSSSSSNFNISLINGEKLNILNDDNNDACADVIFVLPDNRGVSGKLYITNFRLYFRSDEFYTINSLNIKNTNNYLIIDLPLGLINRIEKIGHQSSKQVNFYGIMIYGKNGRRLRFAINKQGKFRRNIYDSLHKNAFPLSNGLNYFAFDYKQKFPDQSGWFVYDYKQEYERIGVSVKTNDWRFSSINQDFKFCDTYPKYLVVPQSVKDEDLRQIAEFRSKHRIPVLSWLKFDNRKNHVALLRSSQPLCGLTQKRSEKDENYLFKIYKLNTSNSLDKLYIMDARPLVNAYANRTTGGGHESEDNYRDCEISFLNIANIHVMRESLRRIFDMALPNPYITNFNNYQQNPATSGASSSNTLSSSNSASSGSTHHRSLSHGGGNANSNVPNNKESQLANNSNLISYDDKYFLINLDNSKWLEHIRLVLNGALKIVKYINTYNSSVLVHCSDGWDRTSQLTSLAMLMMDKYYRTLKGFQVLIEKEWLSFGHRFGIRMGHGTDKHSDQDRSPIFLQFIDCVWQLLQQNSKVFEFNEKLLLTIVNNMYTCQFGTFLYNNEFEREKHDVRNKTVSLWSYINSYKNEFKNSSFIEYDGVVECSTSMSSLQLWTSYYFQYKEIIDDSNITDLASLPFEQQSTSNNSSNNGARSSNQYTMTPPMASSKIFGQAFFHQMVNQMKATVRSYNAPSTVSSSGQEPELIRYKAVSVQQSRSND